MRTWGEIALCFGALAAEIKHRWAVLPPPAGTLPSDADDEALDLWLAQFATIPRLPLVPDRTMKRLAPWLLARLMIGKATAEIVRAQSAGAPAPDFREAIRVLLVEEWRNSGRRAWEHRDSSYFGNS